MIKEVGLFLLIFSLAACTTPRNWKKRNCKSAEEKQAFYIKMFVSCSENNKREDSLLVCCKPSESFIWTMFDTSLVEADFYCYSYKARSEQDSIVIVESLLKEMPIGGNTLFMRNYLSSIVDDSNRNTIVYSQHHERRVDFALLYYIYYDFFLQEKNPLFHNIVLVGKEEEWSNCYPKEGNKLFYGSPKLVYESLEKSETNILLEQLVVCYNNWIKKVKIIGWENARKQQITPFDDCSCHFRRILNDKPHYSRFPRTE